MCSLRDDMAEYMNLGTDIIGISVDMPFALKRFKEDMHQFYFIERF